MKKPNSTRDLALSPELSPELEGASSAAQLALRDENAISELPRTSMVAPAGSLAVQSPVTLPDEEEIQRIVQESNPVLRNLLITQAYYRISRGLAEVMDENNVNWSTFATWASKTAGRSIRNEEVPRFFLNALGFEEQLLEHLGPVLHGLLERFGILARVRHAVYGVLQEVSSQVAEGNLKVFAELAPVFCDFIQTMRSDARERLAEFSARLRPGATEQGGQDLLRAAFGNYAEAMQSPSGNDRAELILLGNCRIGLHEQTRLQPNIQGAMVAPIHELFVKHLKLRLPFGLRGPVAIVLRVLLRHFLRDLSTAWEEVATRYAMNLALPDGQEISLGRDVPLLPSGRPEELERLEQPELVELFHRFASAREGSAANNWARLEDRMGFIVELFRSRQQDRDLFDQPFTVEQTLALESGQVPTGVL